MVFGPEITGILDSFHPVRMEEIDHVRLMNRVDTKFISSLGKLPGILSGMNGTYKVLEVNGERLSSYHNTYLDTNDFLFFNQHVTGKLERNKVRYRKYESTGVTFLEVKKRTNKNRTVKWRIENNLTVASHCDEEGLEFIKEYIPISFFPLEPTLINRFQRITLIGSDIKERITIDFDLSYSDTEGNQTSLPFIFIIELKQDIHSELSPLKTILKGFSIRPVSFSKYCYGTAMLYDIPRKNMLKPIILLLNKIENEYNRCIFT